MKRGGLVWLVYFSIGDVGDSGSPKASFSIHRWYGTHGMRNKRKWQITKIKMMERGVVLGMKNKRRVCVVWEGNRNRITKCARTCAAWRKGVGCCRKRRATASIGRKKLLHLFQMTDLPRSVRSCLTPQNICLLHHCHKEMKMVHIGAISASNVGSAGDLYRGTAVTNQ